MKRLRYLLTFGDDPMAGPLWAVLFVSALVLIGVMAATGVR